MRRTVTQRRRQRLVEVMCLLTLMLGSRLQCSLDGETDASYTESSNNLDGREFRLAVGAGPEPDHQPGSESLTDETKDDDVFDPSRVSNGESSGNGQDGTGETTNIAQSSGPLVGLLGSDQQKSKVVASNNSSTDRMQQSDHEADDDGSVGQQLEGDQGVGGVKSLVEHECDEKRNADDQEGDRLSYTILSISSSSPMRTSPRKLTISPALGLVVGERDSDEEHAGTANQEEQPDQVQLPEHRYGSLLPGQMLDDSDRLVRIRVFRVDSLPLSRTGGESGDDGNGHDRGDDSEHAWS